MIISLHPYLFICLKGTGVECVAVAREVAACFCSRWWLWGWNWWWKADGNDDGNDDENDGEMDCRQDDGNAVDDDDNHDICRLACQMPLTLSTPVLPEATPTTRSLYCHCIRDSDDHDDTILIAEERCLRRAFKEWWSIHTGCFPWRHWPHWWKVSITDGRYL